MRTWSGKARSAAAAVALGALLVVSTAGEARGASGWSWPVEGGVLTPYSNDAANPYAGGMHRGIDIPATVGTPVRAARGGEVTYAGALGYSGLTVAVRTTDGYVTSYLHLSAVAVRRGATVAGGARLGAAGTSGRRSRPEPHLHFGVRLADERRHYVDPLTLLPALPGGRPSASAGPVRKTVPVAPQPERVRAVRSPARAPALRAPAPAPDYGRPLALGGLVLLFLALFGAGALKAAAGTNRAGSARAHAVIGRALRVRAAALKRA